MDWHPKALAFLRQVEARLETVLDSSSTESLLAEQNLLSRASVHLALAGGAKRIRPLLIFYFGQLNRSSALEWVHLAAAAELIHTASLLHDDVVDDAAMRRDRPTANAKWGNTVAVLSGDWLLSLALQEIENSHSAAVAAAIHTVSQMTEASIFEVSHRGSLDVSLDQWYQMVQGKTGALFEWCATSAISLQSSKEMRLHAGICAKHLGIAFQMADDLKDLVVSASAKDPFSDVRNRNLNYGILSASQQYPALRTEIENVWSRPQMHEHDVQELAGKILNSGVAKQMVPILQRHIDQAIAALAAFEEGEATQAITRWANFLADECNKLVAASPTPLRWAKVRA